MNILFVCTGNTCRSPMAEALLLKLAEEKDLDLNVKSAGTYGIDGSLPSINSVKALSNVGIGIEGFRTSSLKEEDLMWADLILTMGRSHRDLIFYDFPNLRDKVFTLKEYVLKCDEDVVDPFGSSLEVYEMTRDEILNILRDFIESLS